MLSAFRPQPIYELKQSDKSKIESVLAFGVSHVMIMDEKWWWSDAAQATDFS